MSNSKKASDPVFTDKQLNLMKNFLAGGAIGGLTTGGIASLLNSYKEKRRRANPDSSADDKILYIDALPKEEKEASVMGNILAPGIALGGGGILWMEAHKALTKAYKKRRLAEVQAELDAAQHFDVGDIKAEAAKEASEEETPSNTQAPINLRQFIASGMPVGLAMLTAYASHNISKKALGKMFPRVQPSKAPRPTRVVVRSSKTQKDVEVPEEEKVAAEREFLLDMACGYDAATGGKYGLDGLVKAAAQGESGVVIRLIEEGDEEALDKLASLYADADVFPRDRRAALRLLAEHGTVAPSMEVKAAAVMASASRPLEAMVKGASAVDSSLDGLLDEFALEYVANARAAAFGSPDESAEKQAAVPTSPTELLSLLMDGRDESASADDVQGSESTRSDEEEAPVLSIGDAEANMRRKAKPNKDVVDAILAATKKQPAATV